VEEEREYLMAAAEVVGDFHLTEGEAEAEVDLHLMEVEEAVEGFHLVMKVVVEVETGSALKGEGDSTLEEAEENLAQ
jgi:hypothetical protein